jgi:YidC/Oxa1 family membrane protein insertase
MSWYDTLLWPIKWVVAWIMVGFHTVFRTLGLDPASGTAWALSIVGLVIVMRILLIPLFVRQIKASRGMQLISPELQAIQKKYKGKTDPASREAMSRETMELYRKHGTNPFSSCLPILAQSPIFFALFRVLNSLPALADGTYADGKVTAIGPLTQEVAAQATQATLFGAPISSFFLEPNATTPTRVVTIVLIVLMSLTTFTTQRQLTQKNMPAAALEGPMAQQQKMLLYVLPLIFAISGVNFPIGVLIYWTTTNLWSMGQQFYVIRRNPTPGSEAERMLKERRARKAAARGIVLDEEKPAIEEKPRGQRQQPKRKDRDRGPRPDGTTGPVEDGPSSEPAPGAPAKRPAGGARPGATTPGTSGRSGGAARAAGSAKAPGGATSPGSGKARPAGGTGKPRPAGDAAGTPRGAGSGAQGKTRAASGTGAAGGTRPARPKPAREGGGGKRPADAAGKGGVTPKPAAPTDATSTDNVPTDGTTQS